MSALKQHLQVKPAFPDGAPAWRAIMGTWKTSLPGVPLPSRRYRQLYWRVVAPSAEPKWQASAAQSPPGLGALVFAEQVRAPATSAQQEETTDQASGSSHLLFAIAVARCDSHFSNI